MRPNMNRWFPWPVVGGYFGVGWRMVALALAAAVVFASMSCCDKSTKPKAVKYNIYVGESNRIYIYDADSLVLLDSVSREHRAEGLAASPDGRFLYIEDREGSHLPSTLWKIDIQTKQAVWSRSTQDLGGGTGIRLLANGALVLVGNGVLRSEDGSLLRRFSDSLLTMYGPVSGNKIVAFRDSVLTIVDAITGATSGRFVPRLPNGLVLDVGYARLHPDGRRILGIGLYGSVDYSWFVVGDVITGEMLFEYRLSLPLGEIAISENGSLAVITDPPGMWGLDPALHIIDLDHRTLVRMFTTNLALQSQVRFLADNTHVVLARASQNYGSGPLQVVDLNGMTVQTMPLPSLYSPFPGGLDIGPRP